MLSNSFLIVLFKNEKRVSEMGQRTVHNCIVTCQQQRFREGVLTALEIAELWEMEAALGFRPLRLPPATEAYDYSI